MRKYMVALTENPFFLDQDQKRWVMDTLAGMTVEEKIGHKKAAQSNSRELYF